MKWQVFIHDIVIGLIITLFMFRLYMPKLRKKYFYFIVVLLILIAILITSLFQNEIVRYFIAVISVNLITLCLFRVSIHECIIKNNVFILFILLCNIASKSLTAAVTGASLPNLVGLHLSVSLASLVDWVLLILCFKLVIYFFSKEKKSILQVKELVFLSLLTFGELMLYVYMLGLATNKQSGIIMILILLCFIILNLYMIRLIQEAASIGILERQLNLAAQQSQIQLKYCQEMSMEQELSHKIVHDVKKHLQILEDLYKFQDNKEGRKYARLLEEELDKLSFSFPCSNPILSVIINGKLAEAHMHHISFEPYVEDVPLDFISELDITAIFSNLLDNAFEACMTLPKEKRFVILSLAKMQEFIVLNVQNPFTTILEKQEGVFSSTKVGHMGIGLSNIRHGVACYDGVCTTRTENQIFIVEITIPIS